MTRRSMPLLLGLLASLALVSASGILEAAGHDHSPDGFCRMCPGLESADVVVSGEHTYRLLPDAAAAPTIRIVGPRSARLMVATPLRGPPTFST